MQIFFTWMSHMWTKEQANRRTVDTGNHSKDRYDGKCTSFHIRWSIYADKWRLVFLIILLAFTAHAVTHYTFQMNHLYLQSSLQEETVAQNNYWPEFPCILIHTILRGRLRVLLKLNLLETFLEWKYPKTKEKLNFCDVQQCSQTFNCTSSTLFESNSMNQSDI